MSAEMKVLATTNVDGQKVLIAKIRVEHEVMFSPKTLDDIRATVARLADDQKLIAEDGAHFAYELGQVLKLYEQYIEAPQQVLGELTSDWAPIQGFLDLDTLKVLDDATNEHLSVRLEGSVVTTWNLVFQRGVEIRKVPATRSNAVQLERAAIEIQNDPMVQASAVAAAWVANALVLVGLIFIGWDRWDKEQEKKREKEEKERQEEENERRKCERSGREPRDISDGGPAANDAFDRFRRTC